MTKTSKKTRAISLSKNLKVILCFFALVAIFITTVSFENYFVIWVNPLKFNQKRGGLKITLKEGDCKRFDKINFIDYNKTIKQEVEPRPGGGGWLVELPENPLALR